MELYDAQKKITLRPCSSPASFPGEVPIRASLVGSKITDFNLMTRRGLFSHTLQHRHLAGQEQIAPLADNLLIWCNTGTLDYNTMDGSLSGSLRTDQGLLVTNLATPLKLRATHACLYIAEIHAS